MELPDRNHKDVSGDWLKEAVQVLKSRSRVHSARKVRVSRPAWGNRLVRYL